MDGEDEEHAAALPWLAPPAPPPELHSALASLQTRIIPLTSWCHNKMGFGGL